MLLMLVGSLEAIARRKNVFFVGVRSAHANPYSLSSVTHFGRVLHSIVRNVLFHGKMYKKLEANL